MTTVKTLNAQLDNNKVSRLVGKACKLLTDNQARVGSVINFLANDAQVTSKLWGFNSSRNGVVIEVAINGVVIDKVHYSRPRGGDLYNQQHKCNFTYLYKLKTGQQFIKA